MRRIFHVSKVTPGQDGRTYTVTFFEQDYVEGGTILTLTTQDTSFVPGDTYYLEPVPPPAEKGVREGKVMQTIRRIAIAFGPLLVGIAMGLFASHVVLRSGGAVTTIKEPTK